MEKTLFTNDEDISFWKNLILVVVFFTIAPVTLGISLFSLFSFKTSSLNQNTYTGGYLISPPKSAVRIYAPLPAKIASISDEVGSDDARTEIIGQYLKSNGSPLSPYAGLIVQDADKYGLDYRLITAIAQQESGLCKIIPDGTFNCWGWGITNGGTIAFKSYQDGIEKVSKGIKENYLNQGYNSISDIMSKYTPVSTGAWANGVTSVMTELQ
jgi:hypothetical protein